MFIIPTCAQTSSVKN